MEPLAVGAEEAGKLVGLSKYTILQLVREGRLEAIHVGRRVLVSTKTLEEFLAAHTAKKGESR